MMVRIIYGIIAFLLGFNIIKIPTWLLVVALVLTGIFFWEGIVLYVGIKACLWMKANVRQYDLATPLHNHADH